MSCLTEVEKFFLNKFLPYSSFCLLSSCCAITWWSEVISSCCAITWWSKVISTSVSFKCAEFVLYIQFGSTFQPSVNRFVRIQIQTVLQMSKSNILLHPGLRNYHIYVVPILPLSIGMANRKRCIDQSIYCRVYIDMSDISREIYRSIRYIGRNIQQIFFLK